MADDAAPSWSEVQARLERCLEEIRGLRGSGSRLEGRRIASLEFDLHMVNAELITHELRVERELSRSARAARRNAGSRPLLRVIDGGRAGDA